MRTREDVKGRVIELKVRFQIRMRIYMSSGKAFVCGVPTYNFLD